MKENENENLSSTLARIRRECEEIIVLSEKATPGPWEARVRADSTALVRSEGWGPIAEIGGDSMKRVERRETANLIAHSRTITPALARAVLGLMDAMERLARFSHINPEALAALQRLAADWPKGDA